MKSLEEAGEELLTVYRYPRSRRKSLRTTNGLERLYLEFRRRVKTQGGLPGESAALVLLYGLVVSGRIRFRRIDGWRDMALAFTRATSKVTEAAYHERVHREEFSRHSGRCHQKEHDETLCSILKRSFLSPAPCQRVLNGRGNSCYEPVSGHLTLGLEALVHTLPFNYQSLFARFGPVPIPQGRTRKDLGSSILTTIVTREGGGRVEGKGGWAMDRVFRVLIIHPNRLFRDGLAFVLGRQENLTVVGAVAHAGEVFGEIERLHPQVIILDLCLPGREGLGQTRQIRGVFPEGKVLMIGVSELESDLLACIEAGAAGYLPQEASLEDLLNNVQAVGRGEALCSPKVVGLLFSRIAEGVGHRERLRVFEFAHLTRRELEIIALIEEGLSNKEIAVRLQIEVQTVKNHVHNILEKLQLDGRRAVARYARERGLVSPLMRGEHDRVRESSSTLA